MIITFASGKGGVGKTTLSLNTAYRLSRDRKILIYDSDIGSSDLHTSFRIVPEYDIRDFISGTHTIDEIKTKLSPNMDLISSPNGLVEFTKDDLNKVIMKIQEQKDRYDYVIIDTHPGINKHNLELMKVSNKVFIIINLEPQSLVDNFPLIKLARAQGLECEIYLICNRISDPKAAKIRLDNINGVLADSELEPILYAGNIGVSDLIFKSVRDQTIFATDEGMKTTPGRQLETIVKNCILKGGKS